MIRNTAMYKYKDGNRKKKSIKSGMVNSFAAILIFVIAVMGISTYINSSLIISDKVWTVEKQNVSRLCSNLDFVMEKANTLSLNLCSDINLNTDFDSLSVSSQRFMKSSFFSKFQTEDFIRSICIYYNESERVLSTDNGVTRLKDYADSDWINKYKMAQPLYLKRQMYKRTDADGNSVISLVRGFPVGRSTELGAVSVNIDMMKLLDLIYDRSDFNYLVLDENRSYIYGNQDIYEGIKKNALIDKIVGKDKFFELKISGNVYELIGMKSEYGGWYVFKAYEKKYLMKEINNTKLLMIILIFLCVAGAILYSLKIVDRVYKPFASLVDRANKISDNKSVAYNNEIEQLNDLMDDFEKKFRDSRDLVKSSKNLIIQSVLLKLCYGGKIDEDEKAVLENLKNYHHFLEKGSLAVIMLHFAGMGERINRSDIERIIEPNYEIVIIEMSEERLTALIGFSGNTEVVLSAANSLSEYMSLRGWENVKIGIGSFYDDLKDLGMSFYEAASALENSILSKKDNILLFDDIIKQRDDDGYDYPVEKEEELAYCIKSCNYEGARAILFELYIDMNAAGMEFSYYSEMLWQCTNAIVRAFSSLGIKYESIDDSTYFDDFIKYHRLNSPEQMLGFILTKINAAVEYIKIKRNYGNAFLVQKIKDYIDYNYGNELSLDILAGVFDVTGVYISSVFKKTEGINVKDYIKNVRMIKAGEMLKNTDKTIAEISAVVGYDNVRSFQRAFKSMHGMSPNDFRHEK